MDGRCRVRARADSPSIENEFMTASVTMPLGTPVDSTAASVGVLFGTFITLLLVPIAYSILDDLQGLPRRLFAAPVAASGS